jgi:alpha-ketoglutarate-dependent taurine dioxygenase
MSATINCTIAKLTDHTGAEVRGVDLSRPTDDALRTRLNRAFSYHSVRVIRDQHQSPHQLPRPDQSVNEVPNSILCQQPSPRLRSARHVDNLKLEFTIVRCAGSRREP